MSFEENEVNDDIYNQKLVDVIWIYLFLLLTIYYNDVLLLIYFRFEV